MVDIVQMYIQVQGLFCCKQIVVFVVFVLLLVYLIYIFFVFDIGGVVQWVCFDNVVMLVLDSWSYKMYVICNYWIDEFKVVIEGECKGIYLVDMILSWIVVLDVEIVIDLGDGYIVIYLLDNVMIYVIFGWGMFEVQFDGS